MSKLVNSQRVTLGDKAIEGPFVAVILACLVPVVFEVCKLMQNQMPEEQDGVLPHLSGLTPVAAVVEPPKRSCNVAFAQLGTDNYSARQESPSWNRSPDWIPEDEYFVGLCPLPNIGNDLKRNRMRCMKPNLRFENPTMVFDLDFHEV